MLRHLYGKAGFRRRMYRCMPEGEQPDDLDDKPHRCGALFQPGGPTWVVCDGEHATHAAIPIVWPTASLWRCHWHIARIAREHLKRLKAPPTDPRDVNADKVMRSIRPPALAIGQCEGWQEQVKTAFGRRAGPLPTCRGCGSSCCS